MDNNASIINEIDSRVKVLVKWTMDITNTYAGYSIFYIIIINFNYSSGVNKQWINKFNFINFLMKFLSLFLNIKLRFYQIIAKSATNIFLNK